MAARPISSSITGAILDNEACVTAGDAYTVEVVEVPGCSELPEAASLTIVPSADNRLELTVTGCRTGRPTGEDDQPGEGPTIAIVALGAVTVLALAGTALLVMMARRFGHRELRSPPYGHQAVDDSVPFYVLF